MPRQDARTLANRLSGLTVSGVSAADAGALTIHFANGAALVVEANSAGLITTFREPDTQAGGARSAHLPTSRQREYLGFIEKYMARYGVAPAETDIQRHFMVSAPSVNQMVQSLERRGFITRRRDPFTGQAIPRSIRVLVGEP